MLKKKTKKSWRKYFRLLCNIPCPIDGSCSKTGRKWSSICFWNWLKLFYSKNRAAYLYVVSPSSSQLEALAVVERLCCAFNSIETSCAHSFRESFKHPGCSFATNGTLNYVQLWHTKSGPVSPVAVRFGSRKLTISYFKDMFMTRNVKSSSHSSFIIQCTLSVMICFWCSSWSTECGYESDPNAQGWRRRLPAIHMAMIRRFPFCACRTELKPGIDGVAEQWQIDHETKGRLASVWFV